MAPALEYVKNLVPHITFSPGDSFYWSPQQQMVSYVATNLAEGHGILALLHETAHAMLGHKHYTTDIELLLLEVEAWDKAKELAKDFEFPIDEDHVQDCLDTYRDWLHQRSTCPRCGVVSFQEKPKLYACFNCSNRWTVTNARFCRPYRRLELQPTN